MRSHFFKSCLLLSLQVALCLLFPSPAVSEDSHLNQALTQFNQGNYTEALRLYDQAAASDRISAVVGAARVRLMTGDYPEAEQVLRGALSNAPDDEALCLLLAELLRRTGRSNEALQVIEPVVHSGTATVCSRVLFGQLLELRGRRPEAADHFRKAVSDYDRGLVFDAREVACVAEACRGLGRFQDANNLFREAVRIDADAHDIQSGWGDLFFEKYNFAEARRSYEQVLESNGRHVSALVGMARVSGGLPAHVFLKTALDINPRHVPARAALAGLLMEDGAYDAASDQLHQALQVNPESTEVLAQSAAIAFLKDDAATFQALEQKTMTLSPGNGTFYRRVAEACGRNYRFAEAVSMAEKAVALDPQNWSGHIVLGMNLLRLGREEQGRAHLETGFQGDLFHLWAMNMLGVLDALDGFETRTTEHFVVRMHPDDAPVLWPYLHPLLEESWQRLTAKYGHPTSGPTLVEIFPRQEDFAVRTSGLPNINHLLGVCFGNVITLSSPRAHNPPGSVNWQEVIWHEFTHVITLQMTRNRIPRWLSEGVSVFEEGRGRPEWGRRQDIELIRALQDDGLIGIADLDAAFSNAENLAQVNFAYYESSLLVAFIVERCGFETLTTLIRRYGGSMSQPQIFEAVLNLSTQELELLFFAWLKDRAAKVNIHVGEDVAVDSRAVPGNAPSSEFQRDMLVTRLEERIAAQPRDFLAHLQLGLILHAAKDDQGAVDHLVVARNLLPGYSASPNPREVLAAIYKQRGDMTSMTRELEALADIKQNAFDACATLGQLAWRRQDYDRTVYYLERALAVNPYDIAVHRLLGAAALQRSDYPRAVREFEVLLALDQTDRALAATDLAEALLRGGDKIRAKHYALAALEIAPMYPRAQDILLDAMAP